MVKIPKGNKAIDEFTLAVMRNAAKRQKLIIEELLRLENGLRDARARLENGSILDEDSYRIHIAEQIQSVLEDLKKTKTLIDRNAKYTVQLALVNEMLMRDI